VFALHVAEALDRVQDVRAQLQSFVRHQATIRENTQAEHEEMVREASVTVVQQRVAFLTRIKVRVQYVGVSSFVDRAGFSVLISVICWNGLI
jgi:hypothetical protein